MSAPESSRPAPESSRPAPADKARWKLALFHTLDASRTSGPGAVAVPAPAVVPAAAPTPSPAMRFEAWAVLSLRMIGTSDEEKVQTLREQNLAPEVWARIDAEHIRILSDDLRAGRTERPALYEAKQKEEMDRRAGALDPAEGSAEADPSQRESSVQPVRAPAVGAGTADSPELGAAIFVAMGRAPFGASSPAPAKRSAKTAASAVAPPSGAGKTMGLGEGQGEARVKMVAAVPFAGSTGAAVALPFPDLTAPQYVSLRAELGSRPDLREEILGRYGAPTEASFGALEEHWRRPELRAGRQEAAAAYLRWMHEVLAG